MGDNKEERSTPTSWVPVSNTDTEAEANTDLAHEIVEQDLPTEHSKELLHSSLVKELLNTETKAIVQYLTSVSPTDESIDAADFDAKIDKVIALIWAEHRSRQNQINRIKRANFKKYASLCQRSEYFAVNNPSESSRLQQVANLKKDESTELAHLGLRLNSEKTELEKKLNSLRRINPFVKVTEQDDRAATKKACEIIEQDLPVVPLNSVRDILTEHSKELLNKLLGSKALSTDATVHNATIDKVSNDILTSVHAHIEELQKLKVCLQHDNYILQSRLNKATQGTELPLYEKKLIERARAEVSRKKNLITPHIQALHREKQSVLAKLNARLKPIPLAKEAPGPSQEAVLLKDLIRLRKQECKFVERQKSIGHDWAEKAHSRCYNLIVELENLLTSCLKPRIEAQRKTELLNLLLQKYPPRFARVEITLSAEDVAKINSRSIELGAVSCQQIPVSENTTVVTTCDGGRGDEHERNFTRRLNTIIEFELGQARRTFATRSYLQCKGHLCVVSALLAQPSGVKELLEQLSQKPDSDITRDLEEELAEAKQSTLLVDRIIAELRSQIEPPEEKFFKAPETVSLSPSELFTEAKRVRTYFEKRSLAEFLEGRHYGVFGNLVLAGAKCILGNDLCERGALLRFAQQHNPSGKPDLDALNYLVQKYRHLVPPDYVDEKTPLPPPKYTWPKKAPTSATQNPAQTSAQKPPAPKPKQKVIQPPNQPKPGPESGNLSVKQLTDRVFGQPDATPDDSNKTQLSFRELRAVGLNTQEAKKLSKRVPKGPAASQPKSNLSNQSNNRPTWTQNSSDNSQSQLKEFNPELPHGFQKIRIPGQKNWYPTRFEPKQADNNNMDAPNIVMKMLSGKAAPAAAGKPTGQQPAMRLPLLSQPMQLPQQHVMSQSGGNFAIQSPHASMIFDSSYPKGIPKSFLIKQKSAQIDGQSPASKNNMPIWPTQSGFQPPLFTSTFAEAPSVREANTQMFGQTQSNQLATALSPEAGVSGQETFVEEPSYTEEDELGDGMHSPTAGQKRLSAFQRLGPVSATKKPKLTINLLFSKDDSIREVVDEQAKQENPPDKHIPVPKRPDILSSTDETVIKYLAFWPWNMNFTYKRTVGPRASKSSMIMEEEQMTEGYESERSFVKVSVLRYPPFYKKEDVLDLVLETVIGKSLIPCFIEFTREECKFLVLRSVNALLALHKKGLVLQENGVVMPVHISLTHLTLSHVGFIPRLVLAKRLTNAFDGEATLDLEAFCMQSDISHFIYFPLNRPTNQEELMHLQSEVPWEYLRELNLASNRLSTIEDFDLVRRCPKLRVLDLSQNHLERVTALLCCRGLPLTSLRLEGNPLCTDYTDPAQYVRVLRIMFPTLTQLDGVKVTPVGELPDIRQNYCPASGRALVDQFLEVFFPLLDCAPEDRLPIEELYQEQATLTVTFNYKLRHQAIFRHFRNLFSRCRQLEEENLDSVQGAAAIAKHIARWPALRHDPYTIHVDVLHHDEATTVLCVGGILKITSESLAEDEPVLSFTRSVVLHSHNGSQYRIHNEMLHWDEATTHQADHAFQITTIKSKKLSLRLESAPDNDLKEKLIAIFMKVTDLSKKHSERCLEIRNWDFRVALEHFMKLLKINSLDTLGVD